MTCQMSTLWGKFSRSLHLWSPRYGTFETYIGYFPHSFSFIFITVSRCQAYPIYTISIFHSSSPAYTALSVKSGELSDLLFWSAHTSGQPGCSCIDESQILYLSPNVFFSFDAKSLVSPTPYQCCGKQPSSPTVHVHPLHRVLLALFRRFRPSFTKLSHVEGFCWPVKLVDVLHTSHHSYSPQWLRSISTHEHLLWSTN